MNDVKEWFKTYYGPSNAVLVLAGDIDLKTAKAEGRKVFRRHSRRARPSASRKSGSPR